MRVKTRLLVLHETVLGSIVKDAFTFGLAAGGAWFGSAIGSAALQWFAVALIFIGLVNRAMVESRRANKTPQQAADWIYREFGVTATVPASGPSIRACGATSAKADERGKWDGR